MHQRANGYQLAKQNYVHRNVMEVHLGRKLFTTEVVHHRDGDRSNNEISNLALFATQAEHLEEHRRQRVTASGGDPILDHLCGKCAETYPATDKTKTSTYCKPCRAVAARESRARRRVATSI